MTSDVNERSVSGVDDILTEATEGICWHKNNWTKSKENGINDCGVPEFLKVGISTD